MTLKDLSRDLGVSPSTISRVLNGCTKNFTITDELRQRILNHVRECGYQANPVFQSIKKRNNRQIAILFYSRSSMGTGYTVEMMVDRAIRFFDENEYDIHFTFNRTLPAKSKVKYSLPPWKCAGLLIPDCHDAEQLSMIEASGTPYVCMNGIAGPNGTSVITDETDSMRQILTHLVKLGHRKIAFVTMLSDNIPCSYGIGKIRLNTFRQEAQKMGLEPLVVQTELAIDAGDFAGANFERFDGTPTYRYESPDFTPCMLQSGVTAVICDSEFVMELLYWSHKAGIRIPEELSVVAYNDQPFLRRTTPPVTTFRIPAEEMGSMASQILCQKLKSFPDYKKGETVSLTGNIVYRESTAPAKISK